MAAFIDMSPELKRPANRSIHPLVLVVLFAAGTVVGYGFNMGVVPAALGCILLGLGGTCWSCL